MDRNDEIKMAQERMAAVSVHLFPLFDDYVLIGGPFGDRAEHMLQTSGDLSACLNLCDWLPTQSFAQSWNVPAVDAAFIVLSDVFSEMLFIGQREGLPFFAHRGGDPERFKRWAVDSRKCVERFLSKPTAS